MGTTRLRGAEGHPALDDTLGFTISPGVPQALSTSGVLALHWDLAPCGELAQIFMDQERIK